MSSPMSSNTGTGEQRPPYVLVHGGRHGSWCWRRVAERLRAAGHEVFTPTLTGLGDRAHLLHRDIGLDTHVRDLVAVFEFEDLANTILVGHSYGGMVVSGAMEHIADRVRRLVFLDAHMPTTGESMLDMVDADATRRLVGLADEKGEGWYLPPTDASYWGITDPDDIAWVNARITAQPLRTYLDPVGCTDRAWAHPGTFIECGTPLQDGLIPLHRPRARSAEDPQFRYRVLDAPHDAMITDAEALTSLLIEAAD